MGKSSKKHAKGRLDKYFHMAKEQGYRARSAFKLIQLNKKYDFLTNATCLIDLCAAPGGWLQVASKYMPSKSLIVGLDLVPIKPIPGVTTFVQDITTEKCRSVLRSTLKHFQADVVVHDGAPNVGTSWLHDAFTQSELVLSSLKLATQFLKSGGTFVSKVFRSKDYNKLLWVFNQLFEKVEATKPSSSRNVSAEIFVVCQGYYAPKKIDPKFLDPKWVFKEIDEYQGLEETDEKKKKESQSAILNDLLHPEKRRRQREGYADGDYTLHSTSNMSDFVDGNEHIILLSKSSALKFDDTEFGRQLESHPLTSVEIKECVKDLKVLGKKDFRTLLKWREQMRIALGIDKTRSEKKKEAEEATKASEEVEESAEQMAENESRLAEARLKRQKKKARERKAKNLLKMRLGMDVPMDIGIEASQTLESEHLESQEDGQQNKGLFSINEINMAHPDGKTGSASETDSDADDDGVLEEGDDDSEAYSSDEEAQRKVQHLEDELDTLYDQFQQRLSEKDPIAHQRAQKKKSRKENKLEMKEKFEEWYGAEYEKKLQQRRKELQNGDNEDSSDEENASDNEDVLMTDSESETEGGQLSNRAKTFFDNPLFTDGLQKSNKEKKSASAGSSMFSDDVTAISSSEDEEEEEIRLMNSAAKRKRELGDEGVDDRYQDNGGKNIEMVPKEVELMADDIDDDQYLIKTAAAYTMAEKLLRPSGRRDLIDGAFNRYSYNDPEGLPSWFVQDEGKHRKPTIPVTKEAAKIMKERMKDLNARPIKKVAEAKFRKRYRAIKRAEKFAEKADALNEDTDIPDGAKAKNIVKLMSKAYSKKQDKKPALVVAKGSARGVKGRPKGVKGRYKMVDPRMKKELRADKKIKKANKKKRR